MLRHLTSVSCPHYWGLSELPSPAAMHYHFLPLGWVGKGGNQSAETTDQAVGRALATGREVLHPEPISADLDPNSPLP